MSDDERAINPPPFIWPETMGREEIHSAVRRTYDGQWALEKRFKIMEAYNSINVPIEFSGEEFATLLLVDEPTRQVMIDTLYRNSRAKLGAVIAQSIKEFGLEQRPVYERPTGVVIIEPGQKRYTLPEAPEEEEETPKQ